jgi:hypothetical protein
MSILKLYKQHALKESKLYLTKDKIHLATRYIIIWGKSGDSTLCKGSHLQASTLYFLSNSQTKFVYYLFIHANCVAPLYCCS